MDLFSFALNTASQVRDPIHTIDHFDKGFQDGLLVLVEGLQLTSVGAEILCSNRRPIDKWRGQLARHVVNQGFGRRQQVGRVEGIEADAGDDIEFGEKLSTGNEYVEACRRQLAFSLPNVGTVLQQLGRNTD